MRQRVRAYCLQDLEQPEGSTNVYNNKKQESLFALIRRKK